MSKAAPILNDFTGGELSPLINARSDAQKFEKGLQVCLNWIPFVHGPIARRPGTFFIGEVKDSSKFTRLIPFEASEVNAYALEFGQGYIRFFKNGGVVTNTVANITAATQTNPVTITAAGHGFSNGDNVVISKVVGMEQINNREFEVTNVAGDDFDLLGIDGTGFSAYSSGGEVAEIFEIVSPYQEADIDQIKFVQSVDVLYLVHPTFAPRKLSRFSDTNWTLGIIDFLDGPYFPTNTTATTLNPSATTGSITLTASTATFAATDVGRSIRIEHGTTWGWCVVDTFTNDTTVTCTVQSAFGAATATTSWRLGLWSDTTGYPSTDTFFEGRLFFGGTSSIPNRIDGSKSEDFENFASTATDGTVANDNAVSFSLLSRKLNSIRWLADDEKGLIIGTAGAEWLMRPNDTGSALSPTNVNAKISTRRGSANFQPVQVGRNTLFVQKLGRKLREWTFGFQVDGHVTGDVTRLSQHITKDFITQLATTEEPSSIIWAIRNDGALLGMTYEIDEVVFGWHRHFIGGTFAGGNAVVESIMSIPNTIGTADDLWMIVKRTINGGTKRYVELMGQIHEEGDDPFEAHLLDSALIYDGAANDEFGGLFHLQGETIKVLVDAATHPDLTVANSKVTLLNSLTAQKVRAGFGYTSDGLTMRFDKGAQDGTSLGKTRRNNRVGFMLSDTGGLKIGPNFNSLDAIPFRLGGDITATAVPLFTGIKSKVWDEGYNFEGFIAFRVEDPLPCTILAILPQMEVQDRL